ncbi:MAG: hypothetical protein OEX07_04250 [Gammaproteobacteria bacterium]|nr:hypothetical protein [Gammaproteobacteria bacterium]
MSKGFQLATLAGALTIALSGNVSALDFGGWDVKKDGNIDITNAGVCVDAAYTCSVVASGAGFKQVSVSNALDPSDNVSYIMTIVTDQNAGDATGVQRGDLGFSDVSFVKMKLTLGGASDAGESGITASQIIKDTGTGTTFSSTTDINTGWAATADANVRIAQNLFEDGGTPGAFAGDDFKSGFTYASNNDATSGVATGFEIKIDQTAGLASGTQTDPSANDVQVFALREKSGDMLTSAKATPGIDLTDNNIADGVTWVAGNDIKAIWIGQQINLGTSTDLLAGSLGSSFGYLSFDNLSNDAPAQTAFGFGSKNSTSAWVWDDAFHVGTGDVNPVLNP